MKHKTLGQWLGFIVILILIIAIGGAYSFTAFTLANYSDTVDRVRFSINMEDSVETHTELLNLNYFYNLSKEWHLQWAADKYLFEDAPFYEVADTSLTKDWKKVIEDLKDKQDHPMSYMYGNAKFRQAQAEYQAGKKEALDFVMTEVASDFEKALRVCLDSGVAYLACYDRVWNYDLATNKKSAQEALQNPGKQPKFILGPLKSKEGPPMIPDKKEKGPGPNGTEEGGQGGPRKRP